jgi:hypothetical protein
MLHLFCYIFGFSLGTLCERVTSTKYYNDKINKLLISNKKYKSFIFHRHLLEDWKNYNKEYSNNKEHFDENENKNFNIDE